MSKWLVCLLITFSAYGSEGLNKALERLAMTTDMLICIGDEMVGDPYSGMLTVGDTISINLNLSHIYSYQFIIWTESSFNYVDFWLTDPFGDTPRGDLSDHTTLTVIPDSTESGIWFLEMELLEGAYSDTAYYAAAVFRGSRILQ